MMDHPMSRYNKALAPALVLVVYTLAQAFGLDLAEAAGESGVDLDVAVEGLLAVAAAYAVPNKEPASE